MEGDVLALVPGDLGEAHLGEQDAQQLDVGRGIFDELEAVGAHRIFEAQGAVDEPFRRQRWPWPILLFRGPPALGNDALQDWPSGFMGGAMTDSPPAGWTPRRSGKALVRSVKFKDFSEAFAFLTRVALHAEKVDHHPEFTSVWNRVDFRLTSHDAGGVTTRDTALAEAINSLAVLTD